MSLRGSYNKTSNTYLTKSRQNVDLWTFCDHDKDISRSQQAAKILKIEKN
jgi:hypothetical protein